MEQQPDRRWLARIQDDLDWDFFQRDCILVTASAIALAGFASLSDGLAKQVVTLARGNGTMAAALATAATPCLLRIAPSGMGRPGVGDVA